jgi:RNA ligase
MSEMFPLLPEILDMYLLDQMTGQGFVRARAHPTLGLTIYNYTAAAQYANQWNDVTRACRGLVVRADGRVVARPFEKFFNAHEHEGLPPALGGIEVTDKVDGSLGILVPTDSGHIFATRGSFESDQALHATGVWQRQYAHLFTPNPAWTYLFEIVYPQGRIVIDYGAKDDLVLLGAVNTFTGEPVPLTLAAHGWPGEVVEQFHFDNLAQALNASPRPGAEGIVIWFVGSSLRVKVKQAEYVRLHKLVTELSSRRIWEALASGDDVSVWLDAVPDEFYAYVREEETRLRAGFDELATQVAHAYAHVAPNGSVSDRAGVARALAPYPKWVRSAVFSKLDNKNVDHLLWAQIRPAEHVPYFSRTTQPDVT